MLSEELGKVFVDRFFRKDAKSKAGRWIRAGGP